MLLSRPFASAVAPLVQLRGPVRSLWPQMPRATPTMMATFSELAATSQPSTRPPNNGVSNRVYSAFHVYKTKAAMCIQLVPPTFVERNGSKSVDRDGAMLLEFASLNPGSQGQMQPGASNRTYNWSNKVSFALNAVEIGNMLVGDIIASDKGLVMWHDPAKMGKAGEPMKKLTLKQLPDGNVQFTLNAGNDNFGIPVTRAEFEVIKSIAHYAIPRLLGFDAIF